MIGRLTDESMGRLTHLRPLFGLPRLV